MPTASLCLRTLLLGALLGPAAACSGAGAAPTGDDGTLGRESGVLGGEERCCGWSASDPAAPADPPLEFLDASYRSGPQIYSAREGVVRATRLTP